MKDIFSSDKPVTSQGNDAFQRYFFSKRIAETILNRQNPDGLVIGLYGSWGEGKSSVLNFLETELKDEAVLVIRFNPWSFSYEDNLLINFYNTLATSLEKKLSTFKEKFGKFLEGYGGAASFAGGDLSKIGETLSKVDPNALKDRINDFIKESNKKLVIIIDDIDRLDKSEIFSLIKLVKVNADFFNTYYVLSFDNDMVASSISERFGDGTKQSGEHFLEKIVQVPLRIPKAQQSDLRAFSLHQVERVLNSNSVELSKNEIQTFVQYFETTILHKIETPRTALRYANSISFSVPLLLNEVNNVDLLLIEAVKIFYPDLYEFIQKKPHFFLDSYDNAYNRNINRDEIKKQFLEEIRSNAKISIGEEQKVLELLTFLFPRLNELLNNHFNMQFDEVVVTEKKIGSYNYFRRYFSYCVLQGEISEVTFSNFMNTVSDLSQTEIIDKLQEFAESVNTSVLINRLRTSEEYIREHARVKFSFAIAKFAEGVKTENQNFLLGFYPSSKAHLAYMIKRINEGAENQEVFNLYKELIKNCSDFDFSFEIIKTLHLKKGGKNIMEEKQRQLLISDIRNKMIQVSVGKSVFETFEKHIPSIVENWHNEDPDGFSEYLKLWVIDISSLGTFIKSLSPTMTSTHVVGSYRSNLRKENYDWIAAWIDKDFVYNLIKINDSSIEKFDNIFDDLIDIPSNDQRIRQFEHWYLLEQRVNTN